MHQPTGRTSNVVLPTQSRDNHAPALFPNSKSNR